MEPMLSAAVAGTSSANAPRDLLSRLYREIGISAVAGALAAGSKTTSGRSAAQERRAPLATSAA